MRCLERGTDVLGGFADHGDGIENRSHDHRLGGERCEVHAGCIGTDIGDG
jgi:hypothetical protein